MVGMAARAGMTVDEFLSWEDGTDTRYHLVDGEPVAMAPALRRHNALIMRCGVLLDRVLTAPCHAEVEAGLRCQEVTDTFFLADIAVACDYDGMDRQWVDEPVLIIEVLSPSTRAFDRGVKVPFYREIPSVRSILLLEADWPSAELWRRDGARWIVEHFVGDAVVTVDAPNSSLPLAALYADLPPVREASSG